MGFIFEWDAVKARHNARRHRVTFEEAVSVFSGPYLVTFPDDEHSEVEERFISIGRADRGRVLLVVHTDRCRKVTAAERTTYEQ